MNLIFPLVRRQPDFPRGIYTHFRCRNGFVWAILVGAFLALLKCAKCQSTEKNLLSESRDSVATTRDNTCFNRLADILVLYIRLETDLWLQ